MPRGKRNNKPRRRRRARNRGGRNVHSTAPATNHGARHSSGIGATIGAGLGNWAEKGIRSLFGSGDYSEEHAKSGLSVEANSIVQPMTASQVPMFSTPEHLHGAVRVAHREYVQDIDTGIPGADYTVGYQINPMNRTLFPWLSTLAQNYQQWVACGIVFEFVSTAGNAFSGASAALGDVSMVCEYDLEAAPITTKRDMLNSFYATSAATSQNLMMAVECAPDDSVTTVRFLQQPGLTLFYDNRLNALGNLYIRNTGSQSVYTAGQLWVTYEIILMKPRMFAEQAVRKRYTGSQLARLQDYATNAGNPLTNEQLAYLGALPESDEEKEHQPTVSDVYDNLFPNQGENESLPPQFVMDRTPPVKIPSPQLTTGWKAI